MSHQCLHSIKPVFRNRRTLFVRITNYHVFNEQEKWGDSRPWFWNPTSPGARGKGYGCDRNDSFQYKINRMLSLPYHLAPCSSWTAETEEKKQDWRCLWRLRQLQKRLRHLETKRLTIHTALDRVNASSNHAIFCYTNIPTRFVIGYAILFLIDIADI